MLRAFGGLPVREAFPNRPSRAVVALIKSSVLTELEDNEVLRLAGYGDLGTLGGFDFNLQAVDVSVMPLGGRPVQLDTVIMLGDNFAKAANQVPVQGEMPPWKHSRKLRYCGVKLLHQLGECYLVHIDLGGVIASGAPQLVRRGRDVRGIFNPHL